jgi:Mg-chelatase subunit ChlD
MIYPREEKALTEQVIFLLDVSTSMDKTDYVPTRLEGAKKALPAFLEEKKKAPEDLVAVVTFSDDPEVLLDFTKARGASAGAVPSLRDVDTQGATRMGEGLAQCERMFGLPGPLLGIFSWAHRIVQGLATGRHEAPKVEDRPRRIILISDGIPTDDPMPVVQRLKRAGVVIETVGIGSRTAIDEELLKRIASTDASGAPRYRFVDSTSRLIGHCRELSRKIGR